MPAILSPARVGRHPLCPCGRGRPVRARGLCFGCYRRGRRDGSIPLVRPGSGGRESDRPRCRHCDSAAACRPRGLCWKCHCDPGVRAMYPRDPRTAEGLSDAEILAMPVLPVGDEDVPPPPAPPAGPRLELPKSRRPLLARCTVCGRREQMKARGMCRGCWTPERHEAAGRTYCGRPWQMNAGVPAALHPDTEPHRIAAAQRRVVRDALRRLGEGATAGQVSDEVILPAWVVARRMAELAEGYGT